LDFLHGECTLTVGGRRNGSYVVGGKQFSKVVFYPPYPKFWGAIRRVFTSLEDSGELFIKVDVSEGEQFIVRGFIDNGWGEWAKNSVGYFAIEDGASCGLTGDEEAALRRARDRRNSA